MAIGKIQRIPLREVWRHEEHDFSAWLSENIDVLAECVGMDLTTPEREQPAGDFSVDLVSENGVGETVIIENQLERSDHDHLGKLLTYSAAFDAKHAIWIVGDARSEHAATVAWLNQSSSTSFYLLRAEAVRIGQSEPALNLVLVIGPSRESKAVGAEKREQAERHVERRAFWEQLIPRIRDRNALHKNCSPTSDNWLTSPSGIPGFYYLLRIGTNWWAVLVEIYHPDLRWNKAALLALQAHKAEIEAIFGTSLEWDLRPESRGSWLRFESKQGGYRSAVELLPAIFDSMIDAMSRLEAATRPYLKAAAEKADDALRADCNDAPQQTED